MSLRFKISCLSNSVTFKKPSDHAYYEHDYLSYIYYWIFITWEYYIWNIHSKILNENEYTFYNENNDNEIDSIFNLVIPSNRFQD